MTARFQFSGLVNEETYAISGSTKGRIVAIVSRKDGVLTTLPSMDAGIDVSGKAVLMDGSSLEELRLLRDRLDYAINYEDDRIRAQKKTP